MGLESYSDAELMAIAGTQKTSNASAYSDDELMAIANQRKPAETVKASEPGLLTRIGTDLSKRASAMVAPENYSPYVEERALRMGGQIAGAAGDVVGQTLKSAYRTLMPQKAQDVIASGARSVLETPVVQDVVQGVGEKYGQFKEAYPNVAKDVEAVANIATLVPIGKGAKGVKAAAEVAGDVTGATKGLKAAKQLIMPENTADEALQQILQPKGAKKIADYQKTVEKGKEALKAIDYTAVKPTYEALASKMDDTIKGLVKKQDEILSADRNVYKLDDLVTNKSTNAVKDINGKVIIPSQNVSTNYVEDAITHLTELYGKTGERDLAVNAANLLEKAKVSGLTKKEVNDLARTYNVEFGGKAFQAGVPTTSVSGELYRNVRQGLKDLSRKDLAPEVQELDQTISALYNTKTLMEKNALAAQQLKNKMSQRGLIEKVGGTAVDAIDLATGHFLTGAIRKLVPRGVGLKLQNAAELEKALAKNLQILQKANAAATDAEMMKILKSWYPVEVQPAQQGLRNIKGRAK